MVKRTKNRNKMSNVNSDEDSYRENTNSFSCVQTSNNNYMILANTNPYKLNLVIKNKAISFRLKREMCPFFYQGNFSLQDFVKIHKFFLMKETIDEALEFLEKKLLEGNFEIKEEDDNLKINIKFYIDSIKQEAIFNLVKNNEFDTNSYLSDISQTVIQLVNTVKELKNQISEINKPIKMMKDSGIVELEEEDMIKKWIDKDGNVEFKLLYKSSTDGDLSSDFHSKCDNKGPTISFIQTIDKFRFGGYTSLSWISNYYNNSGRSYFLHDPTNSSFIFSLNKKTKFQLTDSYNAIYSHPSQNVSFGNQDFLIGNCLKETTCDFPKSYGAKEFSDKKGPIYLAGRSCFYVKEIEVFSVINKKKT